MTDVLSDILDTIALKGTVYFRTDLSPPFAIGVPAYGRAARFHIVVQGDLHVALPSGEAVTLRPGDLLLVPHGSAHLLADSAGRTAMALEELLLAAGYTGVGALSFGAGDPTASTQIVCGHFTFADGADHPLLRALPNTLHIPAAERTRRPLLDEVVSLMVRRMFDEFKGFRASVSRLSEVLCIEILRAGIDGAPDLQRVLSAVYDPQIGEALSLIHHRIEHDWTVDSLASEVGMSRSRFAERFRELVGSGPMGYLTDWRLQRARALLGEPGASVKDVAHRVGYLSSSAFSRAFSQKFGRQPKGEKTGTG